MKKKPVSRNSVNYVRGQLYKLIVGDARRRQQIADHAVLGRVNQALKEWSSKDPSDWAYTDEQPDVMEFLPELLGDDCEAQIDAFCAEELSRMGIRDADLQAELARAWFGTALYIIDNTRLSPDQWHVYGSDSFSLWPTSPISLTYQFPDNVESYEEAEKDVDRWLKDVAKSEIMSPLERFKPLAGSPRQLELQICAMFRCRYKGESLRSVAIDLFERETRRKTIADGIKYIQSLFKERAVDADGLTSSFRKR